MTWSAVCLRAMILCVSSCVHCRTRVLTKSLDYFPGTQPGAGLGQAVARKFGNEGFSVALISRSQENLDKLTDTLSAEGITVRGYPADVRDAQALIDTLDQAAC